MVCKISAGCAAISVATVRQITNLWFFKGAHTNMGWTLDRRNTMDTLFAWITFFEEIRIHCLDEIKVEREREINVKFEINK